MFPIQAQYLERDLIDIYYAFSGVNLASVARGGEYSCARITGFLKRTV
jgi:hypothetical protein